MLRPRPTTWFELLVGRGQYALAMQKLAASGAAQLEGRPLDSREPILPKLDGFFAEFHELEAQYAPFWPENRGSAGLVLENPLSALDETIAGLRAWAREAEPLIAQQRHCSARLADLSMVARLVAAMPDTRPLAEMAFTDSDLLAHAIFFVSDPAFSTAEIDTGPEALLELYPEAEGMFVIAIAPREDMPGIATRMGDFGATPVPVPQCLDIHHGEHARDVANNIAHTRAVCNERAAKLERINVEMGLANLLDRVAVLEWLTETSGEIGVSRHLMWITGWTSSPDGASIREALMVAGVDFALSIDPQKKADPPMVLDNPGIFKAFEFFPRMLGVPADKDVDPTPLTTFIAPLLFGFMFGDVGQGLVLLVLGLWLSPRLPLLRMLVPGGIMAIVFGLMFGSVFSIENAIPALWLHPLHEPITMLATALGLGVVLIALAIAMDVTQAIWHRRLDHWLRDFGGIALAYYSLLAAFFVPDLAWGALVGLGLTVVLAEDDGRWTAGAALKGLAEYVETLMRLLVSTVSFSRVGAFALAHAGLSAAIVGVAETFGGFGFLLTLLIGNAIIIGLEGLVTSIQTTRLILFEFFIRFYRAEGREFRPLMAPRPHYKEGLNA